MTDTLRVLTVRQPWAWAIVHGGKDVENRRRNVAGTYRGPVAIHASRQWAGDDALAWVEGAVGWGMSPDAFVLGCVIGVVDLYDAHDASRCFEGAPLPTRPTKWCSPWAEPDHQHLVLTNARPLLTPVAARGRLGLWRPDAALATAILSQLGGAA